ncbi:SAICAR synthase-like protein [Eremomyces bilateralis CBS 781.70]|uniref:Kinase n=1 Tax=Eremomyces bilateralis CBS 781.70 TaxID=1392243 RepID=A0A6G1GGP6_9PEZI|nr:SAICAR synthase-like protein [Eremomyces bilateralis CBS 781.70]KAF1817277.1 SAICAR synthase-like protein [Eremomyces bilateralis CBS 781.70]
MANPPRPPDKYARPAFASRHGGPRDISTLNSSSADGHRPMHHPASSNGEDVTPVKLASEARSKTTPINAEALRSKFTQGPQLDERDSIFATTYSTRESPESSPRLSPVVESLADVGSPTEKSKQMAIPAQRLKEPPIFLQKHRVGKQSSSTMPMPMPYPIGVHRHIARPPGAMDGSDDQPSPRQYIGTSGESHTIEPHDPHTIDKSSPSSIKTLTTHSAASSSRGQSPPLEPQYEEERKIYRSWRQGKPTLARGKTAQSSHVDKKIEATLPKADMSAVARSRKASHTLGIFKENEAAEDKRRTEHLRELMAAASLRQSQREHRKVDERDDEEESPGIPKLQKVVELAQAHQRDTPKNKQQASVPEDSVLQSPEPIISPSTKPRRPYTPRSSLGRDSPSTLITLKKAAEDENDSDREISKALYFPHRQVTLNEEGSEETRTPSPKKGIPIETRPRPVQDAVTAWKADELCQSPGEVEISIKSQDKKQLFHEVGRRATEEPSLHPIDEGPSREPFEDSNRALVDELSAVEEFDMTPAPLRRTKSQYRSRSKPPAPLGAVELEPFDHQVGGHSTVYRFSRAAVCKQLNNRENEFYETVELHHPELLDFLPRYIGVLNVTYRKPSKRRKTEQEQPAGEGESKDPARQDEGLPLKHLVKNQPRIVSHQQAGAHAQVPQVILENNRHIIPEDLFGFPRQRGRNESLLTQLHRGDDDAALDTSTSTDSSPSRLAMRQNAIWGATTVNRKLQEQVLREVFSPSPVHRHSKRERTHPKVRAFKEAQSFSAASSMSDRRSSIDSSNIHSVRRNGSGSTTNTSSLSIDTSSLPPSMSQSAGDRSGFAGEAASRSRAALDTESGEASNRSAISIPRRRRSGGNLRRTLVDLETNKRTALEYHEDEGYGGDREDEAPREDRTRLTASSSHASSHTSSTGSHSSESTIRTSTREDNGRSERSDAPLRTQQEKLPSPYTTPLNPIQSQTQTDARVEHFILLEDLTAGMSRPCVLDLKMGTRQYGVEADSQKQRSQRRKCKSTTSRELGVRVCGMQVWSNKTQSYIFEDKYFGRDLKSGREFQDALKRYFFDGHSYSPANRHIPVILDKLARLEDIIWSLPGYRFYASSLLMLYDSAVEFEAAREEVAVGSGASVDSSADPSPSKPQPTRTPHIRLKIVDFANCVTAEDLAGRPEGSIRCPPHNVHGIDRGYLRGVRSLRLYFQRIWAELNDREWVERGEGEGMSVDQRGEMRGTAGTRWEDVLGGDDGEVSV